MRLLDRYIIKSFIFSYLVCVIFIIGLFAIIDFFGKVDEFLDLKNTENLSGLQVLSIWIRYYLCLIPYFVARAAPFMTVLAAIFTVTKLNKSNEMIPIIMSGTSVYRLLLPIFIIAFLFTGGLIAQQEWVVPKLAREYHNLENYIRGRELNTLSDLSIVSDLKGNKFSAERYDLARQAMLNLEMIHMPPDSGSRTVKRIVKSPEARWRDGPKGMGWYLKDGVEEVFLEDDTIEKRPIDFLDNTDLEPGDIEMNHGELDDLSFSQLNRLFHRFPLPGPSANPSSFSYHRSPDQCNPPSPGDPIRPSP